MKAKRFISVVLSIAMTVSLVVIKPIQSKAAPSGGDNKEIEYNYAKLLQESLYFYDANMCGDKVGERSAFAWRDDCHTGDFVMIDGQKVDVTGGFHDAGDHVKFGLPGGYTATILGISYMEFKEAFTDTKSAGHYKVIADHFAEYFKKCTVLNKDGSVKCFIYQVGEGNSDHGVWTAPENQNGERQVYYTADDNPATDQVSEAIAALTLHYMNFGDKTSLEYAKKLFAYEKGMSKAVETKGAGSFYASSDWKDDYCLAAALLYKATKDSVYSIEFNQYKGGLNIYSWLSWDDVGALADYYGTGSADSLKSCANNMKVSDNGYSCLLEWGSCRYNCNTQFLGLLYDKANGSSTYKDWATFQMNYILGNNNNKQCFVIGYNENSPQYPHHRAASGSGDANQISQNKKTLLGALVGGPKDANGTYTDNQGDYQCNEVALDYNAGLVCAAAALYNVHKDNPNVPKDLMDKDDVTGIELDFAYNDILDECEHDYQEVPNSAVPAGCLTGGKEADKKCTKCGDIIEGSKTNPLGHDYHEVSGTYSDSTCTKTGKEADKACGRCDSVITGATIEKKAHTEVIDPRVEPTTTSVGWTQGSHCSVCNTVIIPQNEIPMKQEEQTEKEEDKQEGTKEDISSDKESGNKEETTGNKDSGNKEGVSSNNNSGDKEENKSKAAPKYSNEWINGKWYNEDGTQTYTGVLTWKVNSTGWWVEDTDGWYPTDQWQKIDGIWYYFKPDGYMATSEYYNGYWFNDDGSWDSQYLLSWKVNSTGWWVEDISGWWPSASWLKINGYWYFFNADGYMVTNCYIDGYWISSDGVCY